MEAPPTYRQPVQKQVSDSTDYSDRIELWSTARERKAWEEQAELFAIVNTLEQLESAFARGAVEHAEYEEACGRLLAQFGSTHKALVQSGQIQSLAAFLDRFHVECPRSVERIRVGHPQGAVGGSARDERRSVVIVKELTENFINVANMLSMQLLAVDQLEPALDSLVKTIEKGKSAGILQGFDSQPLENWYQTIAAKEAWYNLDEDQARQLLYDLNRAKASTDEILNNE